MNFKNFNLNLKLAKVSNEQIKKIKNIKYFQKNVYY